MMTTTERVRPKGGRLERLSNRPEIREEIARLIHLGMIRVRPMPDDPQRVCVDGDDFKTH